MRGKPFAKDNPGKPKGAKTKVTASMREAFKQAFDLRGGVPALMEWADKNPDAFYALAARLIPVEVEATSKNEVTVKFT